jgi:hypothetical protein
MVHISCVADLDPPLSRGGDETSGQILVRNGHEILDLFVEPNYNQLKYIEFNIVGLDRLA